MPMLKPLFRAVRRNINVTATSCTGRQSNPQFEKFRRLQEKFQSKNGLPIFLKGGILDQLFYRGTILLAAIGLVLDTMYYITMAN